MMGGLTTPAYALQHRVVSPDAFSLPVAEFLKAFNEK